MNSAPAPDTALTAMDYLAMLKRRRLVALVAAAVILVISLGIAFGLPAVYRSSSIILIEQQGIPADLVRSTVTSYADQRIQMTSQRVMTTSNLLQIIDQHDLYAEQRAREPSEIVLEGMREDISIEMISADVVDPRSGRPTEATIAFSVAYENENPRLSQRVASELSSLFLSENLKARQRLAQEASTFLSAEASRLQQHLAELEQSLADFKERNVGKLPELVELNLQLMDRTEREMIEVERQVRALEQSEIFLSAQLAQLSPALDGPSERGGARVITTESGQQMVEPQDQLTVLRTSLAGLEARYSPDHPDVVRARREISALEQRVGSGTGAEMVELRLRTARSELAAARERYSGDHPDVVRLERTVANLASQLDQVTSEAAADTGSVSTPNPAYVDIATRRKAIGVELATLRAKYGNLQSKITSYEARLVETPQIEREYRMLTRDYDNALAKYREVAAKQMEAQLAETLETEQKAERFTLIEPPQLPAQPARPPRLVIALLGIMLSIGGGLGTAIAAEAVDDRIHGSRSVVRLVGVPPLAAIPRIDTPRDIRRRRIRRAATVIAVIAAAGLAAAWVHHYRLPLDTAWVMLRGQLGL